MFKKYLLLALAILGFNCWADETTQINQNESPISVQLANGSILTLENTNIILPASISSESAIVYITLKGGIPGIKISANIYGYGNTCDPVYGNGDSTPYYPQLIPLNIISGDPDYNKQSLIMTLEDNTFKGSCTAEYSYSYTYNMINYGGYIPLTININQQ